jgi:hypothetical protein
MLGSANYKMALEDIEEIDKLQAFFKVYGVSPRDTETAQNSDQHAGDAPSQEGWRLDREKVDKLLLELQQHLDYQDIYEIKK